MDTFSACLAFGPLAIFLLLIGLLNLSRRPLVTNGTREMLAIGLALAGLIAVGPMRLFMPQEAAAHFGRYVWVLLGSFYILALTLAIMLSRPKIIVCNCSFDQLHMRLAELVLRLDHESVWAGKALSMPQLRVHLQLDEFSPMQNVTLRATGDEQGASGWRRLEREIRQDLAGVPSAARTHGFWLTACGLAILLAILLRVAEDPQTIARGLEQMLNP